MPEINDNYDLVVYLDVPLDMRMKRIRQRAIDKFGDRVLPGGDMYEQEESFFAYAEKRTAVSLISVNMENIPAALRTPRDNLPSFTMLSKSLRKVFKSCI